jgi:hypothetical protein
MRSKLTIIGSAYPRSGYDGGAGLSQKLRFISRLVRPRSHTAAQPPSGRSILRDRVAAKRRSAEADDSVVNMNLVILVNRVKYILCGSA